MLTGERETLTNHDRRRRSCVGAVQKIFCKCIKKISKSRINNELKQFLYMADDGDIIGGIIEFFTGLFTSLTDFLISLLYSLFYSVFYLLYSVLYGWYMSFYNVCQPLIDSVLLFFDVIYGFVDSGSLFLGLFPDMIAYLIVCLIGLKFLILSLQLILRIIGTLPGGFGGFLKGD